MRSQYASQHPGPAEPATTVPGTGMAWVCADMTLPSSEAAGVPTGAHAAAFDKSTLDWILCESTAAVAGLFQQVWRALADGGLYVLVSFHSPRFMLPLVEASGLFAAVAHHELAASAQHDGKLLLVAVFRKLPVSGLCGSPAGPGGAPEPGGLLARVQAALDRWHMEESPLLTAAEKSRITAAWAARCGGDLACGLALEAAYDIMFVGSIRDDFGLPDFVTSVPAGTGATMNCHQALEFIAANQ